MRKKTIKCLFDNVFWYVVYLLPIGLMLIYWAKTGAVSLSGAMTSAGLGVLVQNPIFDALNGIFGTGGVMPLFSSPDIIMFVSYFASCFLLHLFVDVILLLPRLCHKWMSGDIGGTKE